VHSGTRGYIRIDITPSVAAVVPVTARLTPAQQWHADRARARADASRRGVGAVADLLGCAPSPAEVYRQAFGAALSVLEGLAAIVGELARDDPPALARGSGADMRTIWLV
jgi:hypothetical protein